MATRPASVDITVPESPACRLPQYRPSRYGSLLFLCALGIAGIVLVLIATQRYGPSLSADSVHYIAAAQSLLRGDGYQTYRGAPFTSWPPLFPTAVAGGASLGLDSIRAAGYVNAAAFGLAVVASGLLMRRCVRSRTLCWIGVLTVMLTPALLLVSTAVLTEPLFLLFELVVVLALAEYRSQTSLAWLLLAASAVALGCLTRYAGAALLLAGLVVIALTCLRIWRRMLLHAALFLTVAAAPPAAWLVRNHLLTGTLTGPRPSSRVSLSATIAATRHELWDFLWPQGMTTIAWLLAAALVIALLLAGRYLTVRRPAQITADGPAGLVVTAVVLAVYVAFLIVTTMYVAVDTVNYRLLSPVYPLLLCVLLGCADRVAEATARWNVVFCLAPAGLCFCVGLWTASLGVRAYNAVSFWRKDGAGGYNQVAWRESPLIEILRQRRLKGRIFSNAPDAIWILTGQQADMSPQAVMSPSELSRLKGPGAAHYLVWFNAKPRRYLARPSQLASRLQLNIVHQFPQGTIYEVRPQATSRPVPAGSGTSR